MARREGGCFLVRRVADRGIDKNIGDSRVRGDRLNRDRRSAGRGNEIGNRDPRDIIQIKRLRQRVRDLEEIRRLQQRVRDLEEIRRLHQRVRDLELQREMRNTETESNTVVWDKGGDREQQSCSRHPHRFFEPIYPEGLSEDEPMFDEDEIEVDEEEYWWAQQAINGFANREDEEEEVINQHENSSVSGTFDSFRKTTCVSDQCEKDKIMGLDRRPLNQELPEYVQVSVGCFDEFLEAPSVVNSGSTVTTGGNEFFRRGETVLGVPSFEPTIMEESLILGSINFKIQFKDDILLTKLADNFIDNMNTYSFLPSMMGSIIKDDNIMVGLNVREDCMDLEYECMVSWHKNIPRGPSINKNVVVDTCMESMLQKITCGSTTSSGLAKNLNEAHVVSVHAYPICSSNDGPYQTTDNNQWKQYLSIATQSYKSMTQVYRRHSNASFDPGGTNLKSGEMIREVKFFIRVVIIKKWNRVDVPFDPGGFGSKAKLEDELFSKRGSMMQGYRILFYIYLNFNFLMFCYLVSYFIFFIVIN
ncbi:hypothetical protein HanPI659440_Chr03g0118981 [Helianthus annuus]|nr:hypothetical protein HanPI659440_Chr03g0118981 [Helianthus annuus]